MIRVGCLLWNQPHNFSSIRQPDFGAQAESESEGGSELPSSDEEGWRAERRGGLSSGCGADLEVGTVRRPGAAGQELERRVSAATAWRCKAATTTPRMSLGELRLRRVDALPAFARVSGNQLRVGVKEVVGR